MGERPKRATTGDPGAPPAAAARTFRHLEPVRQPVRAPLDVRCSAGLPAREHGEGRCQLFAGHDGPHAVMFGRCGTRLVRTWRSADPDASTDTGGLQRPWMFGFPVPAWFETDSAPELTG
jgi:hypothetical protein